MSGEQSDGWRRVRLGDVAAINPENLGQRTSPDFAFGYIDISQIDGPGVCLGWTPTTFAMAPSRARRVVRQNDIIVSTVRPYLKAFAKVPTSDDPLVCSTGFAVVRAGEEADQEFLFQHIMAAEFIEHLKPRMTGSNYPAVSASDVSDYELQLPPLDEQRRIAEVLRSMDSATAGASAVLSQAIEARAHQVEQLMALPGEMRHLADVCRLGGGYGFPIKHQGKRLGAYPFAKVSDMNRRGNETEMASAENYVDEADLKVLRAKPFPVGTTFFPKVGATLLTNKRRIASREIIVDNNVMGAVPTDIDPWFLFYAFNTIDMADYVQPGAVPSVNQGTVGRIMIPVPSREVQGRYVGMMRDLDRVIEAQRATISTLSEAKTAVTADLLSGRVRVPA